MEGGTPVARYRPAPLRLLPVIVGVGFALRSILLAVSPVLPTVQRELHLSFAATGTLSALPVLCMGAAAIPAALVVQRTGAKAVIGAGLLLLGVGGALRVLPLQPLAVYACTAVMALGMAVIQPAMSVYFRIHFGGMVQRVSGMFSSSLTLGSLSGASLTILVAGALGWRGTFVLWAIPGLVLAALWWRLAGGDHAMPGAPAPRSPSPAVSLREAIRHRVAWYAAAMFGVQALVFFTAATWIPFRFHGEPPAYLGVILFLFTSAGFPTSVVLTTIRRGWATSRAFYTASALTMLGAGTILLLGIAPIAWLAAGLLNVGITMTFTGANALPPLMARDSRQVGAMAALMLTVGYAIGFFGPQVGGLLVDVTHDPASPFWLVLAAAVALIPLGLTLPKSEN